MELPFLWRAFAGLGFDLSDRSVVDLGVSGLFYLADSQTIGLSTVAIFIVGDFCRLPQLFHLDSQLI